VVLAPDSSLFTPHTLITPARWGRRALPVSAGVMGRLRPRQFAMQAINLSLFQICGSKNSGSLLPTVYCSRRTLCSSRVSTYKIV
jgi:hypothetical protein